MKLNEIFNKSDKEKTSFELSSEDGEGYAEVSVGFDYDIEPTEYEGEFVFYQGGAVFTDYKVEPFEYDGKHYTKFEPEMFKDLVFSKAFETKNGPAIKAALEGSDKQKMDLFGEYMEYLFDEYVAPEIDVPTKKYPDQRNK